MHSIPNLLDQSFKADLHCHSCCSDGSMTPEELIDLAVSIGLKGLSITDHDTVDAYKTATAYAKSKGILLGTGVELSCEHKKKSVHILAYNFSLDDEGLSLYLARQRRKRLERNRIILENLKRLRICISEEELTAGHSDASAVGRPHIAALMVKKGHVRSIQEAFTSYIGDGAPCFARGELFGVKEALSVVEQAGGKAFLAHPHLYSDAGFVKEILAFGFDGLECFYGRFSWQQEKLWLKIAKEKNLLICGGSDFHGAIKPQIPLGCSYVDAFAFSAIFNPEA